MFYLGSIGILLFSLAVARSGEVSTVWENMNPIFLPAFLASSTLLLIIVFSASEKIKYKLSWIMVYSIVCRSFSAIIFPAGGVGPQQGEGLSITRLIFDSTISGGWAPWPPNNVLVVLYNSLRGENFQSALTVIFARMLGIDVYWTHVWLSPVLWGAFVPITVFAIARALGGSETTSILASLLTTAFPHMVLWGTFSVSNSLGFIFFVISLFLFINYLSSKGGKIPLLMAIFFSASLLSHLLTGILTLSLLLLAAAVKAFDIEKKDAPLIAKTTLVSAFLLSTILLPFSLLLQRIIYPQFTNFTLNALAGLPVIRVLSLLVIGEYANFSIEALSVFLAGPLLGFIGIIYMFMRRRKKFEDEHASLNLLFILLGYLMVLIDYRILKFFMINVPFDAERLLVFEYLLAVPFVAFVVYGVLTYLDGKATRCTLRGMQASSSSTHSARVGTRAKRIAVYASMAIVLATWLTSSVYYAYPRYSFLQITEYEIEAARYIETNTNGTYIVICDLWFDYAGGMLVGINNTRAFYFSIAERTGVESFIALREDPSVSTINKTLAPFEQEGMHFQTVYFVVDQPRLGTDEFNRVVAKATENNLGVYRTFGDGKLYIFYYNR